MRSSLLLLAFVGMVAAQAPPPKWQKMPPAKAHEIFPGIPKALPAKGEAVIRMPAKNPHQWSIIMDTGVIFSEQTLLTKADIKAFINDIERYLELLAFAHEYNEWGIQGPPTGFSIGAARAPFTLRRKRSIQKPINEDDMTKMFLAVANKFEKIQGEKVKREAESEVKNTVEQPKKAKDLVELMTAIKKNLDNGEATEIAVPQNLLDYFKIVWKSVLNLKNVGFGESMKNLATTLTGDIQKLGEVKKSSQETSEAKKEESKKVKRNAYEEDEFAALVFNKDTEKKASKLASQKLEKFEKDLELAEKVAHSADIPESFEKVYREGSFGGRNRGHPDPLVVAKKREVPTVGVPEIPSLTLKGKYHLVPKAWSQQEMENFYNAMVEEKRAKRGLRADRVTA